MQLKNQNNENMDAKKQKLANGNSWSMACQRESLI